MRWACCRFDVYDAYRLIYDLIGWCLWYIAGVARLGLFAAAVLFGLRVWFAILRICWCAV